MFWRGVLPGWCIQPQLEHVAFITEPVVSAEEVKTCSREARYRDPEPHRSPAKAKRQTPPPVPRVLSAGYTTGTQPEFRSCLIQTGTILACVRVGGQGKEEGASGSQDAPKRARAIARPARGNRGGNRGQSGAIAQSLLPGTGVLTHLGRAIAVPDSTPYNTREMNRASAPSIPSWGF